MKKIINKTVFPLLVLTLTGCGNVATSTGPGGYVPDLPENPSGIFTADDFLCVDGTKVKTEYGEEIMIEVENWALNSNKNDQFEKYGMNITNLGKNK